MARLAMAVLVAVLVAPATASASFVEMTQNGRSDPQSALASYTLSYTADPGEANDLTVTDGDGIRVRDPGATIRTGANCVHEGADVVCRAAPGTYSRSGPSGVVDLRDGDDAAVVPDDFVLMGGLGDDRLTGGVRIDGGPGGDTIIGSGAGYGTLSYRDRAAAVAVTFDDQPNDGEAGEGDDVRGRFATIEGGSGDDRLSAPSEPGPAGAAASVAGLGGDDRIAGGTGADRLAGDAGDDLLEGNGGDDSLNGDAGADTIRGGPGSDTFSTGVVSADVTIVPDDRANDGAPGEGDDVGSDVENFQTSSGDDSITGTDAANRIDSGAGDDTVLAGGGDDDITAGRGGAALVDAGPGRDVVRYGVDDDDTVRLRDGEVDTFACTLNARPQVDADPFDQPLVCASSLRASSRFHRLRPSRRSAVSLRVACDQYLSLRCRGEIRLVERRSGAHLARAQYDVAPGAHRTIRVRLTRDGRSALRRRRRVPLFVTAAPPETVPFENTIGRGALIDR